MLKAFVELLDSRVSSNKQQYTPPFKYFFKEMYDFIHQRRIKLIKRDS